VNTRGGLDTHDPYYPKGHTKRVEKDVLKTIKIMQENRAMMLTKTNTPKKNKIKYLV
jgi:hypothetical protein